MLVVFLAAAALLVVPFAAQETKMPTTPPGTPIPSRAVADTYRIDLTINAAFEAQ